MRLGGRAAVAEEAVEGVLAVAGVARGDHRVGQVGTADGPRGAARDVVEVDRRAGLGQAGDHAPGARLAGGAQLDQPRRERRRDRLGEVAEDVHRPRGRAHRELDAGHDPDAQLAAGRDRRGHPAQRVVVRDRQDGHAGAGGQPDQRLGRERPVRGERVEVEVGPAGGYAVTARPTRPRASSSARTRPALSAGDSSSVRTCTSGLGGAS